MVAPPLLAAFGAAGGFGAAIGFVAGRRHGHAQGTEVGYGIASDAARGIAAAQIAQKRLQHLADTLPPAVTSADVTAGGLGVSGSFHGETMPNSSARVTERDHANISGPR